MDLKKFPDIKKAIDILGPIKKEVANKLGISADTPIVVGGPDLHTATIGAGAVRNYDAYLCIGTSDWIICHVPYKKTDLMRMVGIAPSVIPGRYMMIDEQEIAGGCLSFLRDNILYHKDELLYEELLPDVFKIFDKIVEKTQPGSNNLIFTPWLFGERTPVEDHTIRAGFYNMHLDTTRGELIRAVFEGVAFNVRWLLNAVEHFVRKWVKKERPDIIKNGKALPVINIVGGGAQSNIWCQIFADVLNRTIRQVKNPIQTNARGAAFLASVALGHIDWDDIPDLIEYSNIFKPNPENRELYDRLFQEYLKIYKSMKNLYKRLNKIN